MTLPPSPNIKKPLTQPFPGSKFFSEPSIFVGPMEINNNQSLRDTRPDSQSQIRCRGRTKLIKETHMFASVKQLSHNGPPSRHGVRRTSGAMTSTF